LNISLDALLTIASAVGLLALVPLALLVAVFAAEELVRRVRHWNTKTVPRPIKSATLLGQKVEFAAQASKELLDTMASQRAELDRTEAAVARLGLRLAQLERKQQGTGKFPQEGGRFDDE